MEVMKKKLTEYNRIKHEEAILRRRNVFDISSNDIGRLSRRDLKVVGVALYWAEGYKTDLARDVEIVNSDVLMIKLMMRWFREICNVSDNKFKIRIQIHSGLNIKKAIGFWSVNTGIPLNQFTKPYTKISPSSKRRIGNRHPYGVCHIRIADTKLLMKIKGWIKGLGGPIV